MFGLPQPADQLQPASQLQPAGQTAGLPLGCMAHTFNPTNLSLAGLIKPEVSNPFNLPTLPGGETYSEFPYLKVNNPSFVPLYDATFKTQLPPIPTNELADINPFTELTPMNPFANWSRPTTTKPAE